MAMQGVDLWYLFTSAEGRINRAKFWLGLTILLAASFAAYLISFTLAGPTRAGVMLSMFLAVLLLYPAYALMAKRFQDRNKPGVIAFIGLLIIYAINAMHVVGVISDQAPGVLLTVTDLLVVGINLWFLIELGLLKGTQGPNAYGPDPLGTAEADAGL